MKANKKEDMIWETKEYICILHINQCKKVSVSEIQILILQMKKKE